MTKTKLRTGDISKKPAALPTQPQQTQYQQTQSQQTQPQQESATLRCALAVTLNKLFDYLPPPHLPPPHTNLSTLTPGIRLELPFGTRTLIGYLVEVISPTNRKTDESFELKAAVRIIDAQPLWDSPLLHCLQWSSRYYHHSLGDVLAAAIPKKLRLGEAIASHTPGFRATETGHSLLLETFKKNQSKQRDALSLFREHPDGLSTQVLKGLGVTSATLKNLTQKALIAPFSLPKFAAKPIASNTSLTPTSTPTSTPSSILKEAPLSLNEEQQNALTVIRDHLQTFKCFLLDGITGSGKTEVYLQLIQALKPEQQTLVLVPEITLAPQTVKRFTQRFNVPIALYHSGLTETQKLESWTQAKLGHAKILIGTRSAVFLPFAQLGLIIIDEEHDPSFKQQDRFAYSARDVGVYRAQQLNATIVLGSATPSLESLYNCQQGRYQQLTLRQRAGTSQPPKIRLIDIRSQALQHGLSQTVIDKIKATLADNKQAMVFLNRRGYAPLMMCHQCGHNFPCPNCDANFTVHKKKQLLKCHHCLFTQPLPTQCPKCDSTKLDYIGHGTERIEADIQSLFPDTQTVRIDRDMVRTQALLKQQLSLLESGQPLILIGTQMVSKGHHFPNVTFVCIVDADTGLFSIDFRASERLAQMTLQVAGRAGRAEHAGEVWLQTRQPSHPTLTTLLSQGYAAFAQTLLEERQLTQLPPYQHLALLRSESQRPALAQELLTFCVQSAQQLMQQDNSLSSVSALGPVAAPMEKRAGHSRYQLLLQAEHRPQLHKLLDRLIPLLENHSLARKVRWRLDVDPIELY